MENYDAWNMDFHYNTLHSFSMVRRSERSLRLEMLCPARTSKYVDNTSVLGINKTEADS